MDKNDEVSARVFLEKIMDERAEAHRVLHELVAKALEIQAKEYERRLDDLNHAHEQSIEDRGYFATKEDSGRNSDRLRLLELGSIDKELYQRDRENDQEKLDLAYTISQEAFRQASSSINNRFLPLEKLAGRAALLFAGSTLIGGIIGAFIQKVLLK